MNPLQAPNGSVARSNPGLTPPEGQHKFFGFVLDTAAGPNLLSVRIDSIMIVEPHPQGGYQAWVNVGGPVPFRIGNDDAYRLLRILGWKEASAIHAA